MGGFVKHKGKAHDNDDQSMVGQGRVEAHGAENGDLHSPVVMPDNRSSFIAPVAAPEKSLRSRHYTTFRQQARFVSVRVSLASRRPNAKCRPLIETLHLDTKVNPYLHDFPVKLVHGDKTSYFRVFLKRGKRLAANQHPLAYGLVGEIVIMRLSASDGTTLVNSRTTDGPIMDFVLAQVRARIQGFQEPKRNALPILLKIKRPTSFAGSP
ncbi:hypothetical protein DFH07DRAFT_974809 [Mycena maculata]|uniref:Uncharacterized protein n=1 Tax=Mycena maculata TaxID=230809 RepID=A0AAD7H5Z1_9AGAR|nr:hypothetical protein DFH07DRAFT_974809 [Mycena maculata]